MGVKLVPFVKAPLPLVVHNTLEEFVAVAVETINVFPSQIISSNPASTVGKGVIVNIIFDETLLHGAKATLVKVKVTVPAAISAALGV